MARLPLTLTSSVAVGTAGPSRAASPTPTA